MCVQKPCRFFFSVEEWWFEEDSRFQKVKENNLESFGRQWSETYKSTRSPDALIGIRPTVRDAPETLPRKPSHRRRQREPVVETGRFCDSWKHHETCPEHCTGSENRSGKTLKMYKCDLSRFTDNIKTKTYVPEFRAVHWFRNRSVQNSLKSNNNDRSLHSKNYSGRNSINNSLYISILVWKHSSRENSQPKWIANHYSKNWLHFIKQ